MDIISIFAENLIFYRKECGYSQEALAFKSNLHRTYISSVERRKRNISLQNISKIAEALEIEPYLLLQRKEKVNDQNNWK